MGIPIAREIVTFVRINQFGSNATEVITATLEDILKKFVEYSMINGSKPRPAVPPPKFDKKTK